MVVAVLGGFAALEFAWQTVFKQIDRLSRTDKSMKKYPNNYQECGSGRKCFLQIERNLQDL